MSENSTGIPQKLGVGNAPEEPIENSIFRKDFALTAAYFLTGLFGFGYALWNYPDIWNYEVSKEIPFGWKIALIVTHLLPYVIVPVTMRVFNERADYLIKKGEHSPFAIQLGLTFLLVSISFEFGWHVQQHWFYHDDFTPLNFMFYFFLISAFALWADGFYRNKLVDLLFVVSLIVASICYVIGASLHDPKFKIPIFIALIIVFGFLTCRAYKVLKDWRVILFPIFSVGVNLLFVFLLNKYIDNPTLNALFHVLHDLAGTETGIIIFTYLVYINLYRTKTMESVAQ